MIFGAKIQIQSLHCAVFENRENREKRKHNLDINIPVALEFVPKLRDWQR